MLAHGADPALEDDDDNTPLHYALGRRDAALIEILRPPP